MEWEEVRNQFYRLVSNRTTKGIMVRIREDFCRISCNDDLNKKDAFWKFVTGSYNLRNSVELLQSVHTRIFYAMEKNLTNLIESLKGILPSCEPVLGWDTETKPGKNGIHILQIAVMCGHQTFIYVIQLQDINSWMLVFSTLFNNCATWEWVGYAIENDLKQLQDLNISLDSIDVTDLRRCQPITHGGLKGQMVRFLRLAPLPNMACTDWSSPLNRDQLYYAALDAYACLHIAKKLKTYLFFSFF